jgi:hypothetical protein
MAKPKLKPKRKTKRIYHGPPGHERSMYWTVTYSPAKRDVIINGSLMHALRGAPGVTIGCALSNMATDNANAFGHPVFLGSFTKTTALIVDRKNKSGQPSHAVLYEHNYPHIVDANDNGVLKKMARENPDLMEREFALRKPRRQKQRSGTNAGKTPTDERGTTDRDKAFVPRGALARAVRAKLIGAHVARQIEEVAAR